VWNEARKSPAVDLFRQLAGETDDAKKLGI
jgi:hypothetical protein